MTLISQHIICIDLNIRGNNIIITIIIVLVLHQLLIIQIGWLSIFAYTFNITIIIAIELDHIDVTYINHNSMLIL